MRGRAACQIVTPNEVRHLKEALDIIEDVPEATEFTLVERQR